MPKPARSRTFLYRQDGVAAIEFAIIFPVILIMIFGMVDLTALVSDVRKMSLAANVVADTVTRLPTPTTPAAVDDAFKAAGFVMRGARSTGVTVEIHNYWKDPDDGNTLKRRWKRPDRIDICKPDTTGLENLMLQGNDVTLAVVCGSHVPIIFELLGERVLGQAAFTLNEQFILRPRESETLICNNCGGAGSVP
jgi:Flp pilus assembly pilin Flp